MNDNDFNAILDELNEGYTYTISELVEINTEEDFREILNSEDFELYVRLLAESNPFYLRNGFALQQESFVMDLARCSVAAKMNFDSQLEYEGTTYEKYQQKHYSECMIARSECFRELSMPHEVEVPSINTLQHLVGTLTNSNIDKYERETAPMQDAEVDTWIKRFREMLNIFGWNAFANK
jgi:hypothetical protein